MKDKHVSFVFHFERGEMLCYFSILQFIHDRFWPQSSPSFWGVGKIQWQADLCRHSRGRVWTSDSFLLCSNAQTRYGDSVAHTHTRWKVKGCELLVVCRLCSFCVVCVCSDLVPAATLPPSSITRAYARLHTNIYDIIYRLFATKPLSLCAYVGLWKYNWLRRALEWVWFCHRTHIPYRQRCCVGRHSYQHFYCNPMSWNVEKNKPIGEKSQGDEKKSISSYMLIAAKSTELFEYIVTNWHEAKMAFSFGVFVRDNVL